MQNLQLWGGDFGPSTDKPRDFFPCCFTALVWLPPHSFAAFLPGICPIYHPVPRTLLLPKDSPFSFSDWPFLLPIQRNENSSISLLYLQCHKRYLSERHPVPGRILFRVMGIHCARIQPSDFYLVPLSSLCVLCKCHLASLPLPLPSSFKLLMGMLKRDLRMTCW